MIYHKLSTITETSLNEFLEFASKQGPKTLFIDSDGGYIDYKDAIVYAINTSTIQVVVVGSAHSAAFDLLLEVELTPIILNSAYSVVHISSHALESRGLRTPQDIAHFHKKTSAKHQQDQLDLYSKFMTPSEIKILEKGGNVYLDSQRLKQIVNE